MAWALSPWANKQLSYCPCFVFLLLSKSLPVTLATQEPQYLAPCQPGGPQDLRRGRPHQCAACEHCGPPSSGCLSQGWVQKGTAKKHVPHLRTRLFVTSLWQSLRRWLKNWLCIQPENSCSVQLSDPMPVPGWAKWLWYRTGTDALNSPGSGCPAAWRWSVHCDPRSCARNL